MNTKRLIKALSAMSIVAMLALPGAAFAMPSLEQSGNGFAGPARNHIAPPGRAVYYAAKERQMDQLENRAARLTSVATRTARHAQPNTYAAFKEQQMERIMNGE